MAATKASLKGAIPIPCSHNAGIVLLAEYCNQVYVHPNTHIQNVHKNDVQQMFLIDYK